MRLLAGMILALAFLSGSAQNIGAQENGLASITIYVAVCPADYDGSDYYADCYPNPAPAGRIYSLHRGAGELFAREQTGSDGFLAFEGIDADGQYYILPPDALHLACSEDGNPFPFDSTQGGIFFDLTTDNDIRCDFFTAPSGDPGGDTGSLTIYKTACPASYTGTDYFEDCYDNPQAGAEFFIGLPEGGFPVTTRSDGVFSTLLEGLHPFDWVNVQEIVPADSGVFVYCSKDGGTTRVNVNLQQSDPDTDGTRVFIALIDAYDGDQIRCDWYNIPAAGAPAPSPAPASPATVPPVTTLPNTGAGQEAPATGTPYTLSFALIGFATIAGGITFKHARGRS